MSGLEPKSARPDSPQPDLPRIRQTGEWWSNPWFFDPSVLRALGVTEALIYSAIERIRPLFPAEWYAEQERKLDAREEWHPALGRLTMGGLMGVGGLLELAEVIDAIAGARKGAPGIRTRLLTAGEFSGAMSEGCIARLLRRDGLPYSFEGRTGSDGPRHDLSVHSEVPFCIEVSRVLDRWDEGPIALLTNRVMHALSTRLTGRNFVAKIDGDLVQFLPGLRSDRLPAELRFDLMLAGWLADGFVTRILEEAGHRSEEFTVEEPGLGTVCVSAAEVAADPAQATRTQSELHGPPIDPTNMVRRVILAVLDKATRQLPKAQPGVVALSVPYGSLDLSFTEAVLQSTMVSGREHLEHLSGVLLKASVSGPEGATSTLTPIENPAARVGLRALPWATLHGVTTEGCF